MKVNQIKNNVLKPLDSIEKPKHLRNIREADDIFSAASTGNLDLVKLLISENSLDVNSRDTSKKTLLHCAASSGNLNLVKYLVQKGADVNAKDLNSFGPLIYAAKNGHLNIVKYFVEEQGVSTRWICTFASRPLAAYYGHLDVVKYLLNKEEGNLKSINNIASLLAAIQNGHLDIVKCLLPQQFDINREEKKDFLLFMYTMELYMKKFINEKKGTDLSNITTYFMTPYNIDFDQNTRKDSIVYLMAHFASLKGQNHIAKYLINEKVTDVNDKYKVRTTYGLLHLAAVDGLLELVEYLIDEKQADVAMEDDTGMTSLLYAAKNDHLNVVKYLIEKGANLTSSENRSPLIFAAENGNLEMVKYLVKKGDNVNTTRTGGFVMNPPSLYDYDSKRTFYDTTSLNNAARKGYLSIISYLLENGADIDTEGENHYRPIHYAAEKSRMDIVKYLVEKGADVNVQNNQNYTPLHFAAKNGNKDILEYLVKNGADINAKNVNGNTPLHFVAKRGSLDLTKYLVEKGANINAKNDYHEYTPALYAAENGHFAIVKYLVDEKHANFDLRKDYYSSILDKVTELGNLDMIKYLLEKGVPISKDIVDYAAASGKLNVVKFFVDKGADPSAKTSWQFISDMTPLHYAAERGHLDIVKYLVHEKHVDINALDNSSWTPLHYAATNGHFDVVKYLIDNVNAIHPNIKSTTGRTPLTLAINNKHKEVAEYIIKASCGTDASQTVYPVTESWKENLNICLSGAVQVGDIDLVKTYVKNGADVNLTYSTATFEPEHSLAYGAMVKGHLDIAKYLIEKEADINAKNKDDMFPMKDLTVLHVAAKNGDAKLVKYLIVKGAEVNSETENGYTPLQLATICCNTAAAKYLKSKSDNLRQQRSIKNESLILVSDFESQYIQKDQITSSSTKPSSWLNTVAYTTVSTILGISQYLYSPFKPTIDTKYSQSSDISKAVQNTDINGILLLLNTFVMKSTGQRFISTAEQSVSLLEATGYALNLTTKFEKIVRQAAKKSKIAFKELNIDFVEVQKDITKKIMSQKFNDISEVLKSHLEAACPDEEKGNLVKCFNKKFGQFMSEFNEILAVHSGNNIIEANKATENYIDVQLQACPNNAFVKDNLLPCKNRLMLN